MRVALSVGTGVGIGTAVPVTIGVGIGTSVSVAMGVGLKSALSVAALVGWEVRVCCNAIANLVSNSAVPATIVFAILIWLAYASVAAVISSSDDPQEESMTLTSTRIMRMLFIA